jgi:hypothetical protein
MTDQEAFERSLDTITRNVRPLGETQYMHPQVYADLMNPNPRAWRRRLSWKWRLKLRWHDLLIWAALKDWRE